MTDAREAPPWEDPRRALRRHGLRPKRSFSQNFLVARGVVERIADAVARPGPGTVVELGPGLGTLTAALLRRGLDVVAVERDREMIAVLEADLGAEPRLRVVPGDAATVDLAALAPPGATLRVAGNLPYAATGAILRNLLAHRGAFDHAVLMMQREVRDRLLASSGTKAYGALTVFVTAGADVESLFLVPRGAFHPAPRVTSAVVRVSPRHPPRAEETDAFRRVVRAAFQERRKTLRNALLSDGILGRDAVDEALSAGGIDGRRRGETLSVEELAGLARSLTGAWPPAR